MNSQQFQNQMRPIYTRHSPVSDGVVSAAMRAAAAPRGDDDRLTSVTQATGKTSATAAFGANSTASYSVQCPQCSHRFRLIDCLLMATAASNSALTLTAGAEAVEPMLSDEDWNSVVEFAQQQENEDRRHRAGGTNDGIREIADDLDASPPPSNASHNWCPCPQSCCDIDEDCCEVSTGGGGGGGGGPLEPVGSSNSRDAARSSLATGRTAFCDSGANGSGGNSTEAAALEVVRNFQIVNITMEQLERVIMDKTDRRIRRISGISGCSIDLRSELPAGRFGVARNFCVLRSRSELNIDSCRVMLSRQLGWNLVAKPN